MTLPPVLAFSFITVACLGSQSGEEPTPTLATIKTWYRKMGSAYTSLNANGILRFYSKDLDSRGWYPGVGHLLDKNPYRFGRREFEKHLGGVLRGSRAPEFDSRIDWLSRPSSSKLIVSGYAKLTWYDPPKRKGFHSGTGVYLQFKHEWRESGGGDWVIHRDIRLDNLRMNECKIAYENLVDRSTIDDFEDSASGIVASL